MRAGARGRPWVLATAAACTALLLVLGAVTTALRLPWGPAVPDLPGLGGLDYRSLRGPGYVPLRDGFVEAALGTRLPAQDALPAAPQPPAGRPVSGPVAGPGRVLPAVQEAQAAPRRQPFTNDAFERAVVVRSLPFDARTDSRTATRQPGEPASCSQTGGTAWYRYTAREDARLVADTSGTRRPVALGVFTGPRLSALRQVGCSSDPAGGAQVVLAVRAGTTYSFQLAGVLGGGEVAFSLAPLGTTSLASGPSPADGFHRLAAVSGDGRTVAYSSTPGPDCVDGGLCDLQVGQVTVVDTVTGRRRVASVRPDGRPGSGVSYLPTLSHDGRYVGFSSRADDLVPGDTNGSGDYFVHDLRTGATVRASVDSAGGQGPAAPTGRDYLVHGQLSADGRSATFATIAVLSEDDLNTVPDVYVRDLRRGTTTLESRAADGGRSAEKSDFPSLSADGRWLAYTTSSGDIDGRRERCVESREESRSCFSVVLRDRLRGTQRVVSRRLDGAPDVQAIRSQVSGDGGTVVWTSGSDRLVPGDTNGIVDVFAWDGRTGRTTRVSVSSTGTQQLDPTPVVAQADRAFLSVGIRTASVSRDGRYVVFDSRAGNLVAADGNGATDVFRHDRLTGTTRRLSVGADGVEGDGDSVRPAVSADGLVVAFESDARRLSPQDAEAVTDVYVHGPARR